MIDLCETMDFLAQKAAPMSDEHLVGLWNDHAPVLQGFLHGQLSACERAAAEDLLQETWMIVQRKFSSDFEDRGEGAFAAWCKQILQRQIWHWRRHRQAAIRDERRVVGDTPPNSSGPGLLEAQPTLGSSPSRHARQQEREMALQQAINEVLNERERLAVELCHLQRQPVDQVAEKLETTPAYVRKLCSQARAKLRRALGNASDFLSG